MINHWMSSHLTSVTKPEFEFQILEKYPDPLRRQLSEGLHILETGGLIRQNEFCQNKLSRIQSLKTEEEAKHGAMKRKKFMNKLIISSMS